RSYGARQRLSTGFRPAGAALNLAPSRRLDPLSGQVLDDEDGGSSGSSSRTSRTSNVRRPGGIVSPDLQFGTALSSVGGSACAPSAVSSLNTKAAIRSPLRGA